MLGSLNSVFNHVCSDVEAYVEMRRKENAKEATMNRELAALRRMFNLRLKKDLVNRKPDIELFQENNRRKGFFEHFEYEAMRAALPC